MNNFQLVQPRDISDAMHCEAHAAMFHGSMVNRYIVTNPTWNNRLNDTTSHAAFREYMAAQLCVDGIQGLQHCKRSGRWSFSSLDL